MILVCVNKKTHKKFTHIFVIVVKDKSDGGRDHHEKYQTQLLRNKNYIEQCFLKTDCDESDNGSELGEHCSSRWLTVT
jgi:hypothetical protein